MSVKLENDNITVVISEMGAELIDYNNITPLTDGELFEAISKEVVSKSIIQNENVCFKSNPLLVPLLIAIILNLLFLFFSIFFY